MNGTSTVYTKSVFLKVNGENVHTFALLDTHKFYSNCIVMLNKGVLKDHWKLSLLFKREKKGISIPAVKNSKKQSAEHFHGLGVFLERMTGPIKI